MSIQAFDYPSDLSHDSEITQKWKSLTPDSSQVSGIHWGRRCVRFLHRLHQYLARGYAHSATK